MTGSTTAVRAVCAALLAPLLAALPAAAQGLDPQLQEIRTLIREKRYPLALESLRLVARQIQDLRLEVIAPAFPAAPAGWASLPPVSLVEEDEIWGDRLVGHRSYEAVPGPARMDLTIDVNTPLGPAVALGFNPLALAADPRARTVEIGGERGLLLHNPDTGEVEVRVLVGRETLVTARGRGVPSPETLLDLVRGVDFGLLRRRRE